MAQLLEDWKREHFVAPDGEAWVFYVVFGEVDLSQPAAREKYQLDGVPDGVNLASYGPQTHPEVVHSFKEGYLWDQLVETNPALASAVDSENRCTVVKGFVPDRDNLNYFRDCIGLIHYLCDCGGTAIYDPQMLKYWSPADWRCAAKDRSPTWPFNHTVTLYSGDHDGEWFHTRGMRKFARPDLSIHEVQTEHRESVIELIKRFIAFQAMGAVLAEGELIRMKGLPAGMRCEHRGHLEDPDFNNRHIEILWPN